MSYEQKVQILTAETEHLFSLIEDFFKENNSVEAMETHYSKIAAYGSLFSYFETQIFNLLHGDEGEDIFEDEGNAFLLEYGAENLLELYVNNFPEERFLGSNFVNERISNLTRGS